MKNKIAAALLAFFVGGLGVHRFYLGQVGRGFLYLIFFWTFIPSILAIIDFVILITMDDHRFDALYNDLDDDWDMALDSNEYASRRIPNDMESRSSADEIEKLHNLMVRGIISEREFETRKSRIF